MASTLLSNMVFKTLDFLSKAQNFVHLGQYCLVQITPAFVPGTYQIMYGEKIRLSVSAFAMVTWKSCNGKFSAKN